MSDEIKVTNIEVKLGDTVQGMTVEQARELLTQLKRLFGEDKSPIVIERREYVPVRRTTPWIQWEDPVPSNAPKRYDGAPIIYCRGDESSSTARLSVTA